MINEQIFQYVAGERTRGATDEVIKSALLAKGWRAEDVSAALLGGAVGATTAPYSGGFSFAHLYEGRLGRMDYFLTGLLLGLAVFLFAAAVFFVLYSSYGLTLTTIILCMIIFLALVLLPLPFSFSLTIRRLHDIGLSGWFCLLGFVPIINILFLALYFIPGKEGANIYGAPPTPRSLVRAMFNT